MPVDTGGLGGGVTVSGDPDAMSTAATSSQRLDERLLVDGGMLSESILRYNTRCESSAIADLGLEVGSLARRWQVLTVGLGDQGIAFEHADAASTVASSHDRSPAPVSTPPVSETLRRENVALATLYQHFSTFDTASQGNASDADGFIGRSDLEKMAQAGGELGDAAAWILEQPELFSHLDSGLHNIDYLDKVEERRFHSSGGDGRISFDDIVSYVQKREVNRILQDVAATIDVAAHGGQADGVLSRDDYESFVRSGAATDEQILAISIALEQGAVDGEQGLASDIADIAGEVSTYSGWAAASLATVSVALTATGALAPIAAGTATAAAAFGAVSTAASAVELGAGLIAGEDEHIVSGGIGLVTAGVAAGSSAIVRGATTQTSGALTGSADDIFKGMLEGTENSRLAADLTEAAVGRTGALTGATISSDLGEPAMYGVDS